MCRTPLTVLHAACWDAYTGVCRAICSFEIMKTPSRHLLAPPQITDSSTYWPPNHLLPEEGQNIRPSRPPITSLYKYFQPISNSPVCSDPGGHAWSHCMPGHFSIYWYLPALCAPFYGYVWAVMGCPEMLEAGQACPDHSGCAHTVT